MIMSYGDSRYKLAYGLKNITLVSNKQKNIETNRQN